MDAKTKERVRIIRHATPDILERLYEISNQICDLCSQPIQDLMLAALDHSTPVIFFARSTMPIEEAIVAANDPKNLRCAHAICNCAKGALSRDEWYSRGLNNREAPRFYTDGELLALQFRLGIGGRIGGRSGINADPEHIYQRGRKGGHIGGRIGGRAVVEKGLGIFAPDYDKSARGRVSGRKNVESGHMARMRALPQTKAAQREWGRINGAVTVRNKTGIHGRSFEQRSADGRKSGRMGGRISGRKRLEESRGIFAPETLGLGVHVRWHVKRDIVKLDCAFCQKHQLVAA